jgi:DNA-binding GntR family transcriptional regulator
VTVDTTVEIPLTDQLRRDVVGGLYNPRERLVEAELAERYGVTRSAMRAALLQLTTEGLVEREPNRGARIRALTVEEAVEIAEVRRQLETFSARLAAERATAEERAQLTELVAEMEAAVAAADVAEYLAENARFHLAIVAMARHDLVERILEQLGNLNFNRHFPVAFGSPRPVDSLAEHRVIAAAIAAGDGDAAAQAMHEHLSSLIHVLRSQADDRRR